MVDSFEYDPVRLHLVFSSNSSYLGTDSPLSSIARKSLYESTYILHFFDAADRDEFASTVAAAMGALPLAMRLGKEGYPDDSISGAPATLRSNSAATLRSTSAGLIDAKTELSAVASLSRTVQEQRGIIEALQRRLLDKKRES